MLKCKWEGGAPPPTEGATAQAGARVWAEHPPRACSQDMQAPRRMEGGRADVQVHFLPIVCM